MPVDRAFTEALREATRQVRVGIRALTTHQVAWGDAVAEAASTGRAAGAVALTSEGAGGATMRHFMVGKDGLDDATVVLG